MFGLTRSVLVSESVVFLFVSTMSSLASSLESEFAFAFVFLFFAL